MVKRRPFVTSAAAKCGPASGMEDTVFCTELATQAAATFVPLGRDLRLYWRVHGRATLSSWSRPQMGGSTGWNCCCAVTTTAYRTRP